MSDYKAALEELRNELESNRILKRRMKIPYFLAASLILGSLVAVPLWKNPYSGDPLMITYQKIRLAEHKTTRRLGDIQRDRAYTEKHAPSSLGLSVPDRLEDLAQEIFPEVKNIKKKLGD